MCVNTPLIDIDSAWQLVREHAKRLLPITLSVDEAQGLTLAEPIFAPIHLPPFDNSAVDGFAVRSTDLASATKAYPIQLRLAYTLAAGQTAPAAFSPHTTVHIMTGAPIPDGFDAVVMQEHVTPDENSVCFHDEISRKQNIRFAGEDVRADAQVLSRGTRINANHIGLLHALGISQVKVYPRPRVAIIATGSELVLPGQQLSGGQVYYCNGAMLEALIKDAGGQVVSALHVQDDFAKTKHAIEQGLSMADVVITVGGISVGKYDFAGAAFQALGVMQVFYQGAWRPGKPLFFGRAEPSKLVFGVPGNPVACYVMGHTFVTMALHCMMGRHSELAWRIGKLVDGFQKKLGFAAFARCTADDNGTIKILPGQGSHELGTLAAANALCLLPADQETLYEGQLVKYLHFPQSV